MNLVQSRMFAVDCPGRVWSQAGRAGGRRRSGSCLQRPAGDQQPDTVWKIPDSVSRDDWGQEPGTELQSNVQLLAHGPRRPRRNNEIQFSFTAPCYQCLSLAQVAFFVAHHGIHVFPDVQPVYAAATSGRVFHRRQQGYQRRPVLVFLVQRRGFDEIALRCHLIDVSPARSVSTINSHVQALTHSCS